MSWSTDFFNDFTYGTGTSGVGAGVNTYYDKRFLRRTNEDLRLIPFGQKRPLPEGNGTTIEWFRWLNISPSISNATLTEGKNPDATTFSGQKVTKSLSEYGAFGQPSSLLKQAHIDSGLTGVVDIFAEHAANVLDSLCHREVCSNGCYCLPADYDSDSSSYYTGTLTGVTSTTVFADSSLSSNSDYGDANDDLNQSVITFTGGPNKGISRAVTDYVTATGTITVSPALPNTPTVGDTFWVATPDAVSTSDALSYKNIKRARTILKNNHAPMYGGYYIGLIDPDQAEALMDATEWKNVMTYKDQTTGIFDGEIGKFGGVRFIEETNSFRFPVTTIGTAGTSYGPGANGGNQTSSTGTGYVTSNLIFGREAFGVTTFAKKGGQGRRPSVIMKNPGRGDTSNPLNRFSTVGWTVEAAYAGLNALFMVNIWTGA